MKYILLSFLFVMGCGSTSKTKPEVVQSYESPERGALIKVNLDEYTPEEALIAATETMSPLCEGVPVTLTSEREKEFSDSVKTKGVPRMKVYTLEMQKKKVKYFTFVCKAS